MKIHIGFRRRFRPWHWLLVRLGFRRHQPWDDWKAVTKTLLIVSLASCGAVNAAVGPLESSVGGAWSITPLFPAPIDESRHPRAFAVTQ